MAKTKAEGSDLVAALEAAGEGDLAAIDARMTELRAEIDEYVASRKRKLDALALIRRSLQFKLHGRQPKVAKTTKTGGGEVAKLIYDLLAAEGSMPVPAIAARLNRTNQSIAICVHKSAWFERRDGEVHIAVRK